MEFIIGITITLTVLYFIMGFGVFNMWKSIVDDNWAMFIILLWPIVLIIPAFYDQE